MIYLYDEAVLEKLKAWFNNPKITISGDTKALFTSQADMGGTDSFPFPLVAVTRTDGIRLLSKNKKPMSFRSMKYDTNGDNTKMFVLNSIPINISYQIDIYTRYRKDCDNILKELVFKLINNPTLMIDIPYGSEKTHRFNMRVSEDIDDNSDIPEHLIRGEYFRQTISLYVDDAYLFEFKDKDIWMLETNVEVLDK